MTTVKPDWIVFESVIGSRAYGLDNAESDEDLRQVYLPPATRHWSLYRTPETVETRNADEDTVMYEYEKFLRLVLANNPNILEILWTPLVRQVHPLFQPLYEARGRFLNKNALYKTYLGYASQQFKKMDNHPTRPWKHAMHLLRLLEAGRQALETGQITVRIDDATTRELLRGVRAGAMGFAEFNDIRAEWERQFKLAYAASQLPDSSNMELANRLLIDARRSALELPE